MQEYGAFLAMLLAEGRYAGVRNLRRGHLRGLKRRGGRASDRRWLDEAERVGYASAPGAAPAETGRCSALSAPGALGAYPWLTESAVAGVLTLDVAHGHVTARATSASRGRPTGRRYFQPCRRHAPLVARELAGGRLIVAFAPRHFHSFGSMPLLAALDNGLSGAH